MKKFSYLFQNPISFIKNSSLPEIKLNYIIFHIDKVEYTAYFYFLQKLSNNIVYVFRARIVAIVTWSHQILQLLEHGIILLYNVFPQFFTKEKINYLQQGLENYSSWAKS